MEYVKGLFKNFIERGKYNPQQNIPKTPVIADLVYWICIFIGLFGIISYICGFRKNGKYTMLSVVIYWIVIAACSN